MKKAFSLIELLIVIVIIGVVYTLAIGNFQKIGDEAKRVTLATLKEYLLNISDARGAKLLCLQECAKCDVLVDGEVVATLENFLDAGVKVYRYEFFVGTFEQTNEVYFNQEGVEKDVCFSYEVDEKGVGEQVFIASRGLVYDFSTYFEDVGVYNSLQEAVDAKEKLIQEVLR